MGLLCDEEMRLTTRGKVFGIELLPVVETAAYTAKDTIQVNGRQSDAQVKPRRHSLQTLGGIGAVGQISVKGQGARQGL